MDVRCDRCSTEYEFDNALVSGRGTTVRCTNCGHQFKVFPDNAGSGRGREQWVIRNSSGTEVTYRSLKGLQQAIAEGSVHPEDTFSKDGGPFRALDTVAELASFFAPAKPAPVRSAGTLVGIQPSQLLAGLGRSPVAAPEPAPPETSPSVLEVPTPDVEDDVQLRAADTQVVSEELGVADTEAFADTQTAGAGATGPGQERISVPPPLPKRVERHQKSVPPPAVLPRGDGPRTVQGLAPARVPFDAVQQDAVLPGRGHGTLVSATHGSSFEEPPALILEDPPTLPQNSVPERSSKGQGLYSDLLASESRFSDVDLGARKARSRWVVALLLMGAFGLVAATVLRGYLRDNATPVPVNNAVADRAAEFVAAGKDAFYAGDLEAAKGNFDKATVLAPDVGESFVWLARVEATKASRVWLLKLMTPAEDTAGTQHFEQQLKARLGKLDKALEAARPVAKTDAELPALEVDALRLSGDLEGARRRVSAVKQDSPETSYVLAMLDLAEPEAALVTATERLGRSASIERGLTRSWAALAFAYARAGNAKDAAAQAGKVASDPELVAALQAYIAAHGKDQPAEAAEEAQAAEEPAPAEDPTPTNSTKDFRKLLEQGSELKYSNPDRAKGLFNEVLSINPGNIEALCGLGDIARVQGQTAEALEHYDRVLRTNPDYLPALMGKADLRWASGDQPGALALYRQVVSQVGEDHPFGKRAKLRINSAGSGQAAPAQVAPTEGATPSPEAPAAAPSPAAPAEPTPAPPAEPPPSEDHSDVDLSDLPGFEK